MGLIVCGLGRFCFVADCATSQLLVLAVILVPLNMANFMLFHFIFSRFTSISRTRDGEDAPDSVVVVQYSSSSHTSVRIFAPSSPRCIVIFHQKC